ncbi:uncharacterized protein Pyn_12253 [Prunus yedoensis var. nudiflora]|uniref:Uncharacterized protein n=1 Tax=Prunus yedoensis var. nudiflora TaxID=2094558 RepID=A0A314UTN2_PRUYE|nr:uncharacterized protein Pyn_12253 [Prunus yedoensis var. nudiflora]
MGVVGATKHLESSRIIAALDVSHSEERLGQFTMENGELFFHTKSPKFKRQIVSAVRDFPPGCGRFAHLNSLRHAKDATSVCTSTESLLSGGKNVGGHRGVEKLMLSNGQGDETDLMNDLEHEASDLLKSMHRLSNNLRPVDKVASVGTAEYLLRRGKNGEGQEIDKLMVSTGQVDETVSMTDRNFCSPPDGSISVSIGNGLEKTAAKKCPSRRLVSAVRDFPPLCGRNACKFGQVKSCMGDEPSQSNTAKTSVKQIREDFQEEFHKNKLGGNVSEVIRDKVQPKCKGHAVQEMERQDKCKPSYKLKVVWKDTREKCIEKSPQESSQLPSNRVIVLALMAPSNSQFRKGRRVRKHIPDGGMSERKRKKLRLKC